MKWASALSRESDLRNAVAEAAKSVREDLGQNTADLVLVFVAPQYQSALDGLPDLVAEHLHGRNLVGCTASGVIGGGEEVEQETALSLIAASLPGISVRPFFSDTLNLPDADEPPDRWKTEVGLAGSENAHFILLADPFSTLPEAFLQGLDYAFPAGVKVGGLASGARQAGQNALFLDSQVFRQGLVGIALSGNLTVDTVVAQGCRPIGQAVPVSRCNQNVLLELNGRSPVHFLKDLVADLNERDRKLMRTSLFLGIEIDPFKEDRQLGDFLIRNLVGVDYKSGAIAVNTLLHDGQVVQFHLRDRDTSAEDLRRMLERYAHGGGREHLAGGLLFSCLGRGEYLYGEKGHDSRVFREKLGAVPLGGLFCNGEIGPVGSATYLHGYTSSFGLFRPAMASERS